jgi:altronate hydrolase
MKIATNSRLFNSKPHWIDFNAGELTEGTAMNSLLRRFINFVVDVASGRLVQNEKNGYAEIAIFKNGVTL